MSDAPSLGSGAEGSSNAPQRIAVPRILFAVIRPFREFFRTQAAGGVILIAATVAALVWANSPQAEAYESFLHVPVTLAFGSYGLTWPLHHWINDALMSVFFLVAGMEIKRELLVGELRTLRRATLPLAAALGGMIVPAAIHASINWGTPAQGGWGIPMATDIAFALGCVALVARRVPSSLVVFLMALAIFDDLGAIVVIALFYGQSVDLSALGVAVAITVILVAMLRVGVTQVWPYGIMGVALWLAVLKSGVHATIAGVVLGLTIPARGQKRPSEVLGDLDVAIARLRRTKEADLDASGPLGALERHLEAVQPPLDRLVHGLHPWVAFLIVPLFAVANAGVSVASGLAESVESRAALGVALGLLFGKPIGIFAATWLSVRTGLAPKPSGASWAQVFGVAVLAGIGFTMSIFVAGLAFADRPDLQDHSKVGIFLGSLICAVAGLGLLKAVGQEREIGAAEPDLPIDELPRFAEGYRLEPWVATDGFLGKSLRELDLRRRYHVSVVGIYRSGRGSVADRGLEPVDADYRFEQGDTLLLVGRGSDVSQLIEEATPKSARPGDDRSPFPSDPPRAP